MKIEAFAEKICSAVEERLGRGFRIEIREVRKNNGILLYGLVILQEGQTVSPTIYLENYLKKYESGTPFEAVVHMLLSVYWKDAPQGNIDMSFFRSYRAVKDRICYRLIGKQGNEALLEEVPHMDFLNMAICFYYAYHGKELGDGSILIYNTHMEMWNTCTEELFRLARENTPRIFPWSYSGLAEILGKATELDGDNGAFDLQEATEAVDRKFPLKVLSNRQRVHGAACILYPSVLEEIAREEGDFYIIPSSIHETILWPYDGKDMAEDLKKMIHEVNTTQVTPEEVLSDSLYYYDSAKKEIVMV